jgi:hypothetical protein
LGECTWTWYTAFANIKPASRNLPVWNTIIIGFDANGTILAFYIVTNENPHL